MFKNYFKIALRNLWRNKIHSMINLLGLAIGITCCMLILLLIRHELSYDVHHPQADRIYRLTTELGIGDDLFRSATSPPPVAWNLKKDFPEIAQVTRLVGEMGASKSILIFGDKRFFEEKGCFVDSTFFQIFHYDFAAGNPRTALNAPNSLVISEKTAQKLFGNSDALDKVIKIHNNAGEVNYKITGILKDKQAKSHIQGNYFMSMSSKGGFSEYVYSNDEWVGNNFLYTYIQLKPHTSAKNLQAKLPKFLTFHAGEALQKGGRKKIHYLQPIKDIHLYSDLSTEMPGNSSISYVYILSAISFLILVIACINFMNLSTARSGKRAKEVGLRKVMGAYKNQLVKQFMGESLLITLLSFMLAFMLFELFLPVFEHLVNQDLEFSIFESVFNSLYLMALVIFVGFLAGCYPAFYLSSFQPINVLKGKLSNRLSANFLRKGLVVFQFSISIAMIAGTILILQQMQFIQNKDLGFEKEQKLTIPLRIPEAQKQYEVLKNEWSKNPEVLSFSGATSHPGTFILYDQSYYREGQDSKDAAVLKMNFTDYDFLKTVGFQLLKGRYFDVNYGADTAKAVLTETSLQRLGIKPEEALGKKIKMQRGENVLEIIGVVKDFHFRSLREPIAPYIFLLNDDFTTFPYLMVSLKADKPAQVLQTLQKTWEKYIPEVPFEYTFLENDIAQQYEADQRFSRTIQYFTGIAILIACLGLFGLASFTAEQRQKEIGIRKVLGASVISVIRLVSKDFLILVLIAGIIAIPTAYYFMHVWLQDFTYRVAIQSWVFITSAGLALFIAFLTISSQAYRAAMVNPVEVLKDE